MPQRPSTASRPGTARPASGTHCGFRCRLCGRVFNIFTGTIWQGTHLGCTTIVLFLRGVVQGVPTLQLADELEVGYETLLRWRHRIQQVGLEKLPADPLPDGKVESDEMFQNAGEKGTPHRDPSDPPRRRANKRRGVGTMENDRPPVLGIVGRESGRVCLTVCDNTQQATIQPQVEAKTRSDATIYTDESPAYARIAESAGDMQWCVILGRSGLAMTMAMAYGKCIATPWKAFGPACGTFSACFAVSTKSFSPVM